jgi:hypothetical protein
VVVARAGVGLVGAAITVIEEVDAVLVEAIVVE